MAGDEVSLGKPEQNGYPHTPDVHDQFTFDPTSDTALEPGQASSITLEEFEDTDYKAHARRAVDIRNNKLVPLAQELRRIQDDLAQRTKQRSDKGSVAPDGQLDFVRHLSQQYSAKLNDLIKQAKKVEEDCNRAEESASIAFSKLGQSYIPRKRHRTLQDVGDAALDNLEDQVRGTPHDEKDTIPTVTDPASAILSAAALQLPQYSGVEADLPDDGTEAEKLEQILTELDKRLFSPLLSSRQVKWISNSVGVVLGINLGIAAKILPPTAFSDALKFLNLSKLAEQLNRHAVEGIMTVLMGLLGVGIAYLVKALFSSIFVILGEAVAFRHPSNEAISQYVSTYVRQPSSPVHEDPEASKKDEETSPKSWLEIIGNATPSVQKLTARFYTKTIVVALVVGLPILGIVLFLYTQIESAGLSYQAIGQLDRAASGPGISTSNPAQLQIPSVDTRVQSLIGLFFILPYALYFCIDGFIRGRDNVYARLSESWRALVRLASLNEIGHSPASFSKAFELRNKAILLRRRLADLNTEAQFIEGKVLNLRSVLDGKGDISTSLSIGSHSKLHFAYIQWKLAQKEYNNICDLLLGKERNKILQENIKLEQETIALQKQLAEAEVDLADKRVEVAKKNKELATIQIEIEALRNPVDVQGKPGKTQGYEGTIGAIPIENGPKSPSEQVAKGIVSRLWDSIRSFFSS